MAVREHRGRGRSHKGRGDRDKNGGHEARNLTLGMKHEGYDRGGEGEECALECLSGRKEKGSGAEEEEKELLVRTKACSLPPFSSGLNQAGYVLACPRLRTCKYMEEGSYCLQSRRRISAIAAATNLGVAPKCYKDRMVVCCQRAHKERKCGTTTSSHRAIHYIKLFALRVRLVIQSCAFVVLTLKLEVAPSAAPRAATLLPIRSSHLL